MKITIEELTPVPPPKKIFIELTQDEATIVRGIMGSIIDGYLVNSGRHSSTFTHNPALRRMTDETIRMFTRKVSADLYNGLDEVTK